MDPHVTHALRYPFDIVTASCLYVDGKTYPYETPTANRPWDALVAGPDDGNWTAAGALIERLTGKPPEPASDLVPVLAYGANGAPTSLARKFADFRGPVVVPMLMVELSRFDVCYSAHLTSYGSIPATLCRSPGTGVRVPVTLLSDPLLAHLHGTEALGRNYRFVRLDPVAARLDDGTALSTVTAYVSLWGPLERDGRPIALDAVGATGRRYPSATERQTLQYAAGQLDHGTTVENLVRGATADPMTRLAWSCTLASRSAPRRRALLSSA